MVESPSTQVERKGAVSQPPREALLLSPVPIYTHPHHISAGKGQRADLKGARSWPKNGLGWSMLAMCAAWPPSWSRVTRAVRPLPSGMHTHTSRGGGEEERKCVSCPAACTHT